MLATPANAGFQPFSLENDFPVHCLLSSSIILNTLKDKLTLQNSRKLLIFIRLEILQPRGKYCNSVGNIATIFWLPTVAIFPNPLYLKPQLLVRDNHSASVSNKKFIFLDFHFVVDQYLKRSYFLISASLHKN